MQLNCVLSDLEKITANLDMYRNFFAMLVWHSPGSPERGASARAGVEPPSAVLLSAFSAEVGGRAAL